MRVITGKGQIVREYILTAPEGTIILQFFSKNAH